jgi:two-component system sensor histidine kinase KdpD
MSSPGKLKIFLGYAAGVGKTYQMLDEAQALKAKGVDAVIGYFEPHGRKDTIAKTEGLETVPRKTVDYRGATFQEMDTEAIIARHPQVAVVDEFPHTNVPGSAREKRWEDVLFLLEHGIDVLTTMNVQHLESLNDHMAHVTGVKVRETIPDWVVKQAVEVVMVDLTPRALLTGWSAAWCIRKTKPNGRWRISSRNRPWSHCARWLCGKPLWKWKSGWNRATPQPVPLHRWRRQRAASE